MNFLFRLFYCIILLIGLSGCISQQNTLVKPQKINQCMSVCVQHLESCKRNCTNNCINCSFSATDTAAVNFFKYTNEIQVQGGYINRRLKSYRDPLQCRKVTCNCTSDFLTCKQSCTGIIQKRLQSLPYCP